MSTRSGRFRLVQKFRTGVVLALFLALLPAVASAAEATPTTYEGHVYSGTRGAPSADKPQSKMWFNDGSWWAVMLNGDGRMNIFELRSHTWHDTGAEIDNRATSTADALWEDGKLVVASRSGSGSIKVSRFSYSSATRSYTIDSGFPKTVASGGSETVTIARDSTKRLWVTYTQSSIVKVAHSTTSDSSWSAPFDLPVADNTVSSDDISAVIALGDKVGIMYSDQGEQTFWFAVHQDGDGPNIWRLETALAGPGFADDHINLKSLLADDDGRIHAAVKTSRTSSDDAIILVLSRTTSGTWSQAVAGQVKDELTRPQLALDRTNKELYVLATAPESGGTVYYKRAPLSGLTFPSGRGEPFITWPGASINNVSVGKAPVSATTGLVAIATDQGASRYYHAELSLGGTTAPSDTTAPSTPTGVTATAVSSTRVDVSWTASTDDTGVSDYLIFRDGTQVGTTTTTSYTDTTVAAGTTYSYAVKARDAAGNTSALSEPAAATTPAAEDTTAPTAPTELTATAPEPARVDLSWTSSTDDVGVTGYTVLRDGAVVGTSTSTSYSDSTVTGGTTYSYTVTAQDAAGNTSSASSPATVTTPSATEPTGAITFRSAATGTAVKSATLVVPAPDGVRAGDVLVAAIRARGNAKLTPPSGWTLVRTDQLSTTMNQSVFWHTAPADGATATTWTFSKTVSAASGSVLAYDGVSTSSPVAAHAAQLASSSTTTLTAPSLTANASDLVIGVFGLAREAALTLTSALVERTSSSASGSSSITGATGDRLLTEAGSAGPFTATSDKASTGIGQTLVLRPAV